MRRQFELANDLAAGLAGNQDAMLRALEERLGLRVYLRGNLLTLDGEDGAVATGARVIEELALSPQPAAEPFESSVASSQGAGRLPFVAEVTEPAGDGIEEQVSLRIRVRPQGSFEPGHRPSQRPDVVPHSVHECWTAAAFATSPP